MLLFYDGRHNGSVKLTENWSIAVSGRRDIHVTVGEQGAADFLSVPQSPHSRSGIAAVYKQYVRSVGTDGWEQIIRKNDPSADIILNGKAVDMNAVSILVDTVPFADILFPKERCQGIWKLFQLRSDNCHLMPEFLQIF